MTESTATQPGRLWILVAVLALLSGFNALRNDLVYDAQVLVKSNGTFEEAAAEESLPAKVLALNALFTEGFWDGVNKRVDASRQVLGQALYRPLMLWPMGVLRVTFGDGSLPFNLLNLLFHVLSAVLVFRLGWILTRRRGVAALAGIVFAVHPLHAEAIAYVAGLGETQSVFLGLLSVVLYCGAATDAGLRPGRLLLAVLAFAAAIFTKEGAATVLVLLILVDLVRKDAPPWGRRLAMLGACAAVIGVNLFIRWKLFGRLAPDATFITKLDNPLMHEGFVARLATGAMLYARSLQLFLVPIGQSADYSFNQLPIARSLFDPAALVALLVVGATTVWGFVAMRRTPALGFGLLAFLFTFGAVSNILVPIGTIFGERLLYLPTVGLSVAAAVLLDRLLSRMKAKGDTAHGVVRGLIVAVVVAFVLATQFRNAKYRSIDTLYRDMVVTAPDSARAWYQRGELARKQAYEGSRESLGAAASDFGRAVRIMPEFMLAQLQLGSVLAETGQFREGMEILRRAEEQIPEGDAWEAVRADVKRRIALVLARASSTEDEASREQAIGELLTMMEEYAADNPQDVAAAVELGVMYLATERLDQAKQLVERELLAHPEDDGLIALAIQIDFKSGDLESGKARIDAWDARGTSENVEAQRAVDLYRGLYHLSMATDHREKGDEDAAMASFDAAYSEFDKLVQLYPDFDQAWFNRGFVTHEAYGDRWEEALKDYQETVRLNPAHPDVFFRISQLLVGQGKVNVVTLRLFQELLALHKDNGFFHVGYGRVVGRMGNHEEAERAYRRAAELGFNGAQVQCALAMEIIRQGRPDDALNSLKSAEKELQLVDASMVRMKGVCHLEAERYAQAISQFETAMRLLEQDASGRYAGLVPQLRFDIAKTKLRVPGQESDGRRELGELETVLERMVAASPEGSDAAKQGKQFLCYVEVQRAWALRNVESMMEEEAAVVLLERARERAEENQFGEVLGDVLEALFEAYTAVGRTEDAAEVKKILEDPGPQLPPQLRGEEPASGS
ncbi:MAG: tetratricopeptide repeat protein [Planctomycetota bacterium JB042]